MTLRDLSLDLVKAEQYTPMLVATQGDYDLTLKVTLLNDGQPTNIEEQTASLRATKPDGQVIIGDPVDIVGGVFTYIPPKETYQAAGVIRDMSFVLNGGDSTGKFPLYVLPSFGDGLKSNSYISSAQEILDELKEATNAASGLTDDMQAKLETDAASKIEEMRKVVETLKSESTQRTIDINENSADTVAAATAAKQAIASSQAAVVEDAKAIANQLADLAKKKDTALTQLEADKKAALEAIKKDGSEAAELAKKLVADAYAAKVTTITADWQQQIDALKKKLTDQMTAIQTLMDKAAKTDLPELQTKLEEIKQQIETVSDHITDSLKGVVTADGTVLKVKGRTVTLPDFALTTTMTAELAKKQPVGDYATKSELPKPPDLTPYVHKADIADMETKANAAATYQTKGNYATTDLIKDMVTKPDADGTYQPKGDYVVKGDADKAYQPKGSYATTDAIKDMQTKTEAAKTYQPIGTYVTKDAADKAYQTKGSYATTEAIKDMQTKTDAGKTYATKAEMADAGKTKTVSLNKGTKIGPDKTGNINLTVPLPDLSGYAKKTDVPDVSKLQTIDQVKAIVDAKIVLYNSEDEAKGAPAGVLALVKEA